MDRILVATDFSSRSDRAARRAMLLARQCEAALTLVHAVDDELPARVVAAKCQAAVELLEEQAGSLRALEGLPCSIDVVGGNVFEAIGRAVSQAKADLLVVGPHRRQAMKDAFIGTTAERVLRVCRQPVLIANAVPAGGYRHILVAMDLSGESAAALQYLLDLELGRYFPISLLHVVELPEVSPRSRSWVADVEIRQGMAQRLAEAEADLAAFLASRELPMLSPIFRGHGDGIAETICATAHEIGADLIVLGSHGRDGLARLLLGSVAEAVLRLADQQDVLVVPEPEPGPEPGPETT